jgi:hypothetical protein
LSPMLFILAMEALSRLLSLAQQEGVIRGMNQPGIKHICSIYADDVILFAHPSVNEANAIRELLRIFGDASGLRTNLAKCSITEIYGAQDTLADVQRILGCQVAQFPIRYLGLPLSTSKVPKAAIHSCVDAVARRLPTCHGPLMARSGRLVWIKSVLSAVPIYSMIADGLPPWATNECRRFLWAGKDGAVRGKCMVAWQACTRPTELGGLGITDLRLARIAFQAKWIWLQSRLIKIEHGQSCQSNPPCKRSLSSVPRVLDIYSGRRR